MAGLELELELELRVRVPVDHRDGSGSWLARCVSGYIASSNATKAQRMPCVCQYASLLSP